MVPLLVKQNDGSSQHSYGILLILLLLLLLILLLLLLVLLIIAMVAFRFAHERIYRQAVLRLQPPLTSRCRLTSCGKSPAVATT